MRELERAVDSIQKQIDFHPKIGLVLGSGLGDYANQIQIHKKIPYGEIPGFPVSTVVGHRGEFLFGTIEDIPVVAMAGRFHYYEGYTPQQVVLPIRVMGLLGIHTLLLTNAAGGSNPDFTPGDLMVITDHISSLVPSPLVGKNLESLGTRFPDMSETYNKELRQLIHSCGNDLEISLREGVYMQFTGPAYETPAEIKMAQTVGADAVGMSTAIEAMAANHMGLRVGGISCITNMASGISSVPLSHKDVEETAAVVAKTFQKLTSRVIKEVGERYA